MTIVFVIDNYGVLTNGTTITAYRFVEALRARGHRVRVVSAGVNGEDMYSLRELYIPIVTPIARKQSTFFAAPDRKVLRKAFSGADVIHFFMPWKLAAAGKKMADEMGIPCTAAFHVQPENITYGAGIGPAGFPLAAFIYFYFRHYFYRFFDNIHCPSPFIAGELKKHHYKAKLHVISNGVSKAFSMEKKREEDGFFRILMVGRFAPEKRQDVLIEAIQKSRYGKKIKLYLAGAGPLENRLRKQARKLSNPVTFGFYQQSDLIDLMHQCDLYVHAADVEIEGISCLEAISCGIVPVIADSKKSATKQFTLDERSLFRAGKAKDLRDKIEYWIKHEDERKKMARRYRDFSDLYRLDYSVRKAEGMFWEAIKDKRSKEIGESPEGRYYKKKIKKRIPMRFISSIIYYEIAIPFLSVFIRLILGVRIKNRMALLKLQKKSGVVVISNHVHILDSAMSGVALFPRKPIFTSIPENFTLPVAGFLVNILGTVPIPQSATENRIFFLELSRHLRKGRFVHVFPEGELIKGDTRLRPFKRGAFQLAVEAQVPVLPVAILFQKRTRGIRSFFLKKRISVVIGDPIYPDTRLIKREAVTQLHENSIAAMEDLLLKEKPCPLRKRDYLNITLEAGSIERP